MYKKLLVGLLCAMFLVSIASASELRGYEKKKGYDYVYLGAYPQTLNGDILPIKWRVLEVKDNIAYLFSEYVLFNHRIHPDDREWVKFGAAFNQTEIFGILNGEFLQKAFAEKEQTSMVYTEELGRIFLVSKEDLKNRAYGFGSNLSRKGFGTEYALANGLFQYYKRYGSHSPYWTRSQSRTKAFGGVCTKQNGSLGYIRVVVMQEGIRPALYLDLSTIKITGGLGTFDEPYILEHLELK